MNKTDITKANFKGAWNEFVTRKKRIKKFVSDCKKLKNDESLKEIRSGSGVDLNKKIEVTPDILKVFFGKSHSFMLYGE